MFSQESSFNNIKYLINIYMLTIMQIHLFILLGNNKKYGSLQIKINDILLKKGSDKQSKDQLN